MSERKVVVSTEPERLLFEALEVLEEWECSDRIAETDHATLATLHRIRVWCDAHTLELRHGPRVSECVGTESEPPK